MSLLRALLEVLEEASQEKDFTGGEMAEPPGFGAPWASPLMGKSIHTLPGSDKPWTIK